MEAVGDRRQASGEIPFENSLFSMKYAFPVKDGRSSSAKLCPGHPVRQGPFLQTCYRQRMQKSSGSSAFYEVKIMRPYLGTA